MYGSSQGSFSIRLQVFCYPSKPKIILRAGYYPVAQFEVEGSLREPYLEPLIEWFNPVGSSTIWGSRGPLGISDWLHLSDGAKHSGCLVHSSTIDAACGWFEIKVWPSPLDWLSKISQPGRQRRIFTLVLTIKRGQLRHEKEFRKTCCKAHSRLEAFREALKVNRWFRARGRQSRPC